jgi:hypothetical protein
MAVQYSRSFSATVPTWDRAKEIHAFLAAFATGKIQHDVQGQAIQTANLTDPEMGQLWDGLTQQADPVRPPLLADGIAWTMPHEYAGLFIVCDSIAAVFAIQCMDEALAGIDRTDAFELRQAMPKAWAAFRKRRQEAAELEGGLGCDMGASWHTLRDIEQFSQSDAFKQKILQIANLAGRMFDHMASTKVKQVTNDPEKVKGATVGGHIERLLPVEQALLGIDATKDRALMKVLKRDSSEFAMKGERTTTRGAIVIALDESVSMRDRGGRCGRNTWAKAVAIALMRIAWQEGRATKVVHFGTSTVTSDVPKNDMRALFEMARSFVGGGTAIPTALDRSREMVGDLEASGFKGADIVFVSDGEDDKRRKIDEAIDRIDVAGIKLHTVGIGQDYAATHPLHARAQTYVFAHDRQLQNVNTAVQLAAPLMAAALDNDDKDGSDLN